MHSFLQDREPVVRFHRIVSSSQKRNGNLRSGPRHHKPQADDLQRSGSSSFRSAAVLQLSEANFEIRRSQDFEQGRNDSSGCRHRLQPWSWEPHNGRESQYRHTGHHDAAKDRLWEQRRPTHEADIVLHVRDFRRVQNCCRSRHSVSFSSAASPPPCIHPVVVYFLFLPCAGHCVRSSHANTASWWASCHLCCAMKVASNTSGRSSTRSSPSSRTTPKPKKRVGFFAVNSSALFGSIEMTRCDYYLQASPISASSSKTASIRSWPWGFCICSDARAPGPPSPTSTSGSSTIGWFWRMLPFVLVSFVKCSYSAAIGTGRTVTFFVVDYPWDDFICKCAFRTPGLYYSTIKACIQSFPQLQTDWFLNI